MSFALSCFQLCFALHEKEQNRRQRECALQEQEVGVGEFGFQTIAATDSCYYTTMDCVSDPTDEEELFISK